MKRRKKKRKAAKRSWVSAKRKGRGTAAIDENMKKFVPTEACDFALFFFFLVCRRDDASLRKIIAEVTEH